MRRILAQSHQTTGYQPIDQNLDVLPREAACPSNAWNGLWSLLIQHAQEAQCAVGTTIRAIRGGFGLAQLMSQSRHLSE